MPKEGKNLKYPASYRPISMLNTDYKILTSFLANRLTKIIGSCVHKDQTGFIKRRLLKYVRRVINIRNCPTGTVIFGCRKGLQSNHVVKLI